MEQPTSIEQFQNSLTAKLKQAAHTSFSALRVPVLSHEDAWLFDAHTVAKIVLPERIVAVPGASKHVVGITNVGGILYTVLDFNALLNRSAVERTPRCRVICLDLGSDTADYIALYVDRVLDFVSADRLLTNDTIPRPFSTGTLSYGNLEYQVAPAPFSHFIAAQIGNSQPS